MTTFNFRLIVLSLFTLSLVFISCSKDEEEVIVMMEEEIDGSCPYAQLFHEKDGLVRGLRIPTAADFYGEKASTGERVYPKGVDKTPNPEGTSKDGWLKCYMNRLDEWFWRSSTNDGNPFNIFAQFESPGTYDIENLHFLN